jgi:hypothetical protein
MERDELGHIRLAGSPPCWRLRHRFPSLESCRLPAPADQEARVVSALTQPQTGKYSHTSDLSGESATPENERSGAAILRGTAKIGNFACPFAIAPSNAKWKWSFRPASANQSQCLQQALEPGQRHFCVTLTAACLTDIIDEAARAMTAHFSSRDDPAFQALYSTPCKDLAVLAQQIRDSKVRSSGMPTT